MLVVVDNCEHVLAAAAEAIGAILSRSDAPRVLATSREHLRAPGETSSAVPPLTVDGVTSDAVTLFVERARAVRPGFGIFDEQTADAMIRDLQHARRTAPGHRAGRGADGGHERGRGAATGSATGFRLLTGPELGPDRQATLRHAVAWSYDLLNEDERETLRTMSVFSGGFDLPALCAVAEANDDIEVLRLLDSLVRKSLVSAHHGSAQNPVQPLRDHPCFADERLERGRRARGGPRPARGVLRGRGGPAVGALERAGVADAGRLGPDGAGEPAVGVPVEPGPRRRRDRPRTSPPTPR